MFSSILLTYVLGFRGQAQVQAHAIPGFSNIVVIRNFAPKLEDLVSDSSQFLDSNWVKKLGKTYTSKEGANGLLVVAEISALIGPQDKFLTKLLELGGLDPKGVVIDGKDQRELGEALAAISPFDDSRSALTSGKYRLQVRPLVQIAYQSASGSPSFANFRPQIPPTDGVGLSSVTSYSQTVVPKPMKARKVVYEEYYRRPGGRTKMVDAQKLVSKMSDSQHESIMKQLFARCSMEFGNGLQDIDKLSDKVHDWKDLPFDFKSMLQRQDGLFTDNAKGIPENGTISGITYGISLEMGFSDPSGTGKLQILGIIK